MCIGAPGAPDTSDPIQSSFRSSPKQTRVNPAPIQLPPIQQEHCAEHLFPNPSALHLECDDAFYLCPLFPIFSGLRLVRKTFARQVTARLALSRRVPSSSRGREGLENVAYLVIWISLGIKRLV
jgi:hypothetical protein